MPQRVVFSFDDRSLESLKKMTEQGRVPGSVCPCSAHRVPTPKAFKEVTVRNPETDEERVIVIPDDGGRDLVPLQEHEKVNR